MEEFVKIIYNKAILEFRFFFSVIPKIISAPREFFASIDESHETFIRASSFALVISCVFVLLSIPSYKINGVSIGSELFLLDIVFNWLLLLIYGIIVWLSCRIVIGKSRITKCLSAFFYSCSILIIVKFLEIPARIVRDNVLVNADLTSDTPEKLTDAVFSNPYSFASEIMVGLGYVWFLVVLVILVRETNRLGWIRSILASIIAIVFIALAVSWIQRPITHALLSAFLN